MSLTNTLSDFELTTNLQSSIHRVSQDENEDYWEKIARRALSYLNHEIPKDYVFEGPRIEDTTNFTPRFHMTRFCASNLPDIKDDDEPIQWRRIRLKPIRFSPPLSGNDLIQNNSNVQNAMIERKPNY